MKPKTQLDVNTAISGLAYSCTRITKALTGRTRKENIQAEERGPFATAITRIAEIADGGPIENRESAREEMLFLFETLPFLRGGFYDAAWRIIEKGHEILADRITIAEAATILEVSETMVKIQEEIDNLHLVGKTQFYANYQVQYLKAKRDRTKQTIQAIKEQRHTTDKAIAKR